MYVYFLSLGTLASALAFTFPLLPRSVSSESTASVSIPDLLSYSCCPGSGLLIFSLNDFSRPLPVSSPGLVSLDHTPPAAGWPPSLVHPGPRPLLMASCMSCLPPAFSTPALAVVHNEPRASHTEDFPIHWWWCVPPSPQACHLWALALQPPAVWNPVCAVGSVEACCQKTWALSPLLLGVLCFISFYGVILYVTFLEIEFLCTSCHNTSSLSSSQFLHSLVCWEIVLDS